MERTEGGHVVLKALQQIERRIDIHLPASFWRHSFVLGVDEG